MWFKGGMPLRIPHYSKQLSSSYSRLQLIFPLYETSNLMRLIEGL